MKQIDIKKPKYIIPILILPFILGIGWLVKDMINSAPAEETTLVETEELNLDIPDANLEKSEKVNLNHSKELSINLLIIHQYKP